MFPAGMRTARSGDVKGLKPRPGLFFYLRLPDGVRIGRRPDNWENDEMPLSGSVSGSCVQMAEKSFEVKGYNFANRVPHQKTSLT
jgi:hypothetical protein